MLATCCFYLARSDSSLEIAAWPVSLDGGFLFNAWVITVIQWLIRHSHIMIAVDTAESSKEVLPVRVVSSFNSRCDVTVQNMSNCLPSTWCHPGVLWTWACIRQFSLVAQLCPTLCNPMDSRPHQIQAFLDRRGSWESGGKNHVL